MHVDGIDKPQKDWKDLGTVRGSADTQMKQPLRHAHHQGYSRMNKKLFVDMSQEQAKFQNQRRMNTPSIEGYKQAPIVCPLEKLAPLSLAIPSRRLARSRLSSSTKELPTPMPRALKNVKIMPPPRMILSTFSMRDSITPILLLTCGEGIY